MEHLTDKELLNFALDNGMIDFNTIQKQFEMNERKKYLEMHKSKVWPSTDGKWYTFLPDISKEKGRKLVKRGTKEDLEDYLVLFYKDYEEPQTLEKTFWEWINKKIKFGEITKQTADRYESDFYKFFSGYEKRNIKFVSTDFLEDFIIDNIKNHNLKSKAWSNLRTIIRGMFLFAKKKGYSNLDIVSFISELDISRKMFNHEKKPIENVIYTEKETEKIVDYISTTRNLNDIAILFAVYTGMRVGKLIVICLDESKTDKWHSAFWKCKCDCGNIVVARGNNIMYEYSGIMMPLGMIAKLEDVKYGLLYTRVRQK